MTLDTPYIWSHLIDQIRRRIAQSIGMLCPLTNKKSDLSFGDGVLLYKQLIRPMMDNACPHGDPLAAPTFGGCKCYKPRVFAFIRCPCYVGSRQIHEDLGGQLSADHIKALTTSFDSKLADVLKNLPRQLGRYLS